MVSTTQQHQAYNQKFSLDDWIQNCASQYSGDELKLIRRAAELVLVAHRHQRRASGEPYVHHVFAVAEIVSKLNMDHETVCAAILHDVVEDTDVELEQVKSDFGPVIASMVDGVTKMSLFHLSQSSDDKDPGSRDKEWANAENLRKLLLAMVDDVRVVLIKLADRLHNMRTLNYLPEANQKRIASETMEIFAPLANRMGIWQIKWELEDLSLRYLEPASYKRIARMLDERRVDRERYIANAIERLQAALSASHIKANIAGRPKHIYSIWKKMKRKGVDFHEIFDVRALRIVVGNLAECYGALGVVHTLWKHIPREFDDYIATPKGNMYQSLHTAVIGPEGKTLEVQIRTGKMDEHAELGVAAHWRYKEGSSHFDEAYEQKIAWLRQLLEWKEEEPSAGDFIDRFKAEAFEDRVYVLTPRGNVIDLPSGATPLDFAYYIHTDIGHRCRGAKVDGSIVPLTYQLQNGEQVEVLTTRHGTPSRDWLNPNLGYLRTSRARAKARSWFSHQDLDQNISDGQVILVRELGRLGLSSVKPEQLISRFHCQTVNELMAQIGRGEITTGKLANAAHDLLKPHHKEAKILREVSHPSDKEVQGDVSIQGVGNLLTRIARCCKPAPNDPIVGFITLGRGVTIHRSDCPNILRLPAEKRARMIEVAWNTAPLTTYPVDIHILAYDRQGLLRDVTQILTNSRVNVLAVNTMTDVKDHMARMSLTVEVVDTAQLSDILERIRQLSNVVEANRKE